VTDINNSATVREVLLTTAVNLTLSGLAREVLLVSPTAVTFGGLAREILLVGNPLRAGQTAVSINSG
jgi:hypothetical protein